ncbi:MAG TPA: SIS domain-containing protein [Promineifilum sp.]
MIPVIEFDKTASIEWYFAEIKTVLDQIDRDPIRQAISILHKARIEGRQIFILGNGGSASTASHMVCDLAKNTRGPGWPHYKVIGLSDNIAILSAYGNDDGYENVFALQLANLINPGDIVVAISTSGNSPNVLRAVELANEHGATVIGMTGFGAGKLGPMVDVHLHVPSDCIEQVEDIHLMLEHLITKALRDMTRSA